MIFNLFLFKKIIKHKYMILTLIFISLCIASFYLFSSTYDQNEDKDKIHDIEIVVIKLHIYENGDIYEGEWKDDKEHGKGNKIYASGSLKGHSYEGNWKNG